MSKKKRSRKPAPNTPAVLLVSYVPLLKGKAGITFDLHQDESAVRGISEQVAQAPSGQASCCLWMLDDDNLPAPVLVIEKAAAIAQHLKDWADNQPAKWFKVYLKEKDGKYALALFPDVKRSLARFQFARLLEGGDPIASGQVQIITRPLHFVSGAHTAYAAIKDRIGKAIQVGLLDREVLDPKAPLKIDLEQVISLGQFEAGDNSVFGMDNYLDGLIAGGEGPPIVPSQINPAALDRLKS